MSKKNNTIKYFLLYLFERTSLFLLTTIVRIIPIKFLYNLLKKTGVAGSYVLFSHRRRIMKNLDLAFGSEKSKKQKKEIYRAVTANFVISFFEAFSSLYNRNKQYLIKSTRIVGQENLDASLRKGKGVIAVSGHIGSFGIMGVKMKAAGYRFYAVIRGLSNPYTQKRYSYYCNLQDQRFIFSRPYKEAIKSILRALRKNEIVLLVTDENRRHGGVFVDFFNHPAATAVGSATLQLRTGADIVPMFMVRNQDNTHTLVIEPALEIAYTENRKADIVEITQLITKRIENHIRRHPSQWSWSNRRWRTRPPEEQFQEIYRNY